MSIGTPVSLGTNTSTGVQSSNQLTTTAAIPAGAFAFAVVEINSNAAIPTVASLSDGTNSYSKVVGITPTGNIDWELWACPNCAAVGSSATLKATWSGSNGGAGAAHSIQAGYVTGLITAPNDTSVADSTHTATPSVSSGTLAQAVEIAIGCAYGETTLLTDGAGFTNLSNTSQSGNVCRLSYQVVSSTASVTFAPTWSGAANQNVLLATFKGVQLQTYPPGQAMLGF